MITTTDDVPLSNSNSFHPFPLYIAGIGMENGALQKTILEHFGN